MFVVLFASLLTVGFAVPPIWYTGGQCGVSQYSDAGEMVLPPGAKIVGGQEARPYEFPWQVSFRRGAAGGGHFCGGSILNERWVVTAAHCMVDETTTSFSIVLGEHERGASSSVRQIRDAETIFIHESYDALTMQNDVALIKTTTNIIMSANILPVCGPEPTNTYHYSLSQTSGWGTLTSGGVCCPLLLRYVTLNVTTNGYCDEVYTVDTIYNDMICASDNVGGQERDSCQGDSGGPLTVKDASGIFSLVGIVSWGIGCASGYPGVYARVGYHADWITNTITTN